MAFQEFDTSGNEGQDQVMQKLYDMLKEIYKKLDEHQSGTKK